jgi:hypothetical protein
MFVVIIGIVFLFCLIFAIFLVIHWLSARGRFMFLDNVVHDRAEIKAPWAEFRETAWSFFWFRFWFGQILGGLLLLFLFIAAIPMLVQALRPDEEGLSLALKIIQGSSNIAELQALTKGSSYFLFLALSFVLIFPTLIFWGVAETLLGDFIVPIMYLRRLRTWEAIGVFRAALMPGYVGGLVVYVIVRWILRIATGLIALLVILCTCCFCCLGFLPVVSSIALLPIAYFMRCYSLYYLEQYGPVWEVFPPKEELQPIHENPVLMV